MLITHAEFMEKPTPIFWMRAGLPSWGHIQRDIILKWIDAHIGGWVYINHDEKTKVHTYFFEKDGDRVYFAMWMKGDPFSEDYGEILPYDEIEANKLKLGQT